MGDAQWGLGRVGKGEERRGLEGPSGGRIKHTEGVAYGAFRFLNPTTRREEINWEGGRGGKGDGTDDGVLRNERSKDEVREDEPTMGGKRAGGNLDGDREKKEIVFRKWRSRDNRKGRHAITLTPSAASPSDPQYPTSTSTYHAIRAGLLRIFTRFPYYDISYLIAIIFTLGSLIWCINAFFVWLPLESPSSEFPGEIADAGSITAFIGATVFQLGSILLMLEAVNEDQTDCFGWAIEEFWEEETKRWRKGVRKDRARCRHHHRNRKNLVGKSLEQRSDAEEAKPPSATTSSTHTWQWFPSLSSLSTHYIHSLGFLACSAQLFGATIFWISGFTALPPIYNHLTSARAQNSAYWLPQVIGGTGFIISGLLFMLETQSAWYKPAWRTLGWHIGGWNLVGGIGFTLCGALGFAAENSGAVYQGSLATFWGSWCFLVGSLVQWYESLEKFPVEVEGQVMGK